MRSFLSKALPTLTAALLSVASVASADNKVTYDQGYPVDESQMKGIYNSQASIDVESSWDFYVNGGFIYWFAKEQGLDFGVMQTPRLSITGSTYDMLDFPFEYKPGFKAGVGTHFDYDDWNVYAQYTRLMFRKSHYVVDPVTTSDLFSTWDSSPYLTNPYFDLKTCWKLSFNIVDLECSRPYFVGKKLSFTPHAGLRGGWINQRYNLTGGEKTLSTLRSLNKSNTWLTGIKAGVDTNWTIGGGFRFLGNAAGSLNYQHCEANQFIDTYVTALGPSSTHTVIKRIGDEKGQITPNFEAALGMGWGTYLDNNNWHFDITAAYEFTYYWNQNKMRSLNDASSNFIDGDAGDLMLHGLTMNARVDF